MEKVNFVDDCRLAVGKERWIRKLLPRTFEASCYTFVLLFIYDGNCYREQN